MPVCSDLGVFTLTCTQIGLSTTPYRLQLAALHFNENSGRKQVVIKEGKERYDIVFPKYKKGGYVVRRVLEDPTYGKFVHICGVLACL